ncbi:MAG: COX15/CtaA family protein [Dehalococcoidia bacterium]|nr:COX15/CtaA family protein [Dehalococcoidia bacterium]
MTRFQRLTVMTVVATLALIGMGATVRITGSGLGCPDWPLCHGGFLPPAEQAPVIEWSHRALAGAVGILIVVQATWAVTTFRRDRRLVTAVALTLPLLLVQALLGREAVVRELPPAVVAVHMVSAQLLLALLVMMAVWAVRGSSRRDAEDAEERIHRRAMIVAVSVGLTMAVGAYMLATGAGFACSGWPGCAEAPIPFVDGGRLEHIHWLHRLLVGVTFAAVAWLAWTARGVAGRWMSAGIRMLTVLYAAQILVGAANLWFDFARPVRVAHLVLGSVVWAIAVALAVASRRPGRTE